MADDVTEAFCARKMGIDAALAEIAEHSANHFNVLPDQVTWGHVGILADIEKTLDDLADRLARRAEYATRDAQTGASPGGIPSPE